MKMLYPESVLYVSRVASCWFSLVLRVHKILRIASNNCELLHLHIDRTVLLFLQYKTSFHQDSMHSMSGCRRVTGSFYILNLLSVINQEHHCLNKGNKYAKNSKSTFTPQVGSLDTEQKNPICNTLNQDMVTNLYNYCSGLTCLMFTLNHKSIFYMYERVASPEQ